MMVYTGVSIVGLLVILLVGLPVLGLLAWGVVGMLKSRTGRRVLAVVGLMVLVLVGGAFFFTAHRVEVVAQRGGGRVEAVVVERGPGYQVARVSSEAVPAAVWSAGLEEQFVAEPYSSVESAARALGRQLAQEVRQVAGEGEGEIHLYLDKDTLEQSTIIADDVLRHAWATLLEETTRSVDKDVEVKQGKAEDGQETTSSVSGVVVEAEMTLGGLDYESGSTGKHIRSTLRLALHGPAGEVSRPAEFVEKDWVADFAGFVNRQHGRSWLVARSQETAMDAAEAHRQAMGDAVAQVQTMLGDYGGYGKPVQVSWGAIERYGFVADTFVQSLQTTTGRVYREAVLLDVSADKMLVLRQRVLGQVAKQRWTWAGMAVSLAGMLGVIVAVYVFLNAATKGYYTWALRIGVVVLALGLGGVVWFIVVHGYWLNVK